MGSEMCIRDRRERVERARIEDLFVVDQFVVFGTGSGAELVLFGIPVHAVGLDDRGDAGLTRGWAWAVARSSSSVFCLRT